MSPAVLRPACTGLLDVRVHRWDSYLVLAVGRRRRLRHDSCPTITRFQCWGTPRHSFGGVCIERHVDITVGRQEQGYAGKGITAERGSKYAVGNVSAR